MYQVFQGNELLSVVTDTDIKLKPHQKWIGWQPRPLVNNKNLPHPHDLGSNTLDSSLQITHYHGR